MSEGGVSGEPNPGVYLLGTGGHALSVADVVDSLGLRLMGAAGGSTAATWSTRLIESDGALISEAGAGGGVVIVAIGDNRRRMSVQSSVPSFLRCPALVAPSASAARGANLGAGSVVHHQAHVGPHVWLGEAVVVNTGAVVEHGCEVQSGAHVAPGAYLLGGVAVGEGALVGSGARVLPNVRIGAYAVVGAGAVVVKDVPDGVTVIGVPAREVKRA